MTASLPSLDSSRQTSDTISNHNSHRETSWKYHNASQTLVWTSDEATYEVIPIEIEELQVQSAGTKKSVLYDSRDDTNRFFFFKPKTPINLVIKLKSTEENPSPANSVHNVTFHIVYKDELPSDAYNGDPNFLYIPNVDFKSPHELSLKDVRIMCTMTQFKKFIFHDSEFETKEKPKFTLLIKVWSGKNYASVRIPFKLNPDKASKGELNTARSVSLTNAEQVQDSLDDAALLEEGKPIYMRTSKKRSSSTPLKPTNSHPEKKRRISNASGAPPARSVPVAGYITPYQINYSSMKAIIDCEPLTPMQRPTQIIVTAEQNTKLKLQTDTGILVSMDIFNPVIDNLQSKFAFVNVAQVSLVTPSSIPANVISTLVTVNGQFPFHNVLSGKFDVTFGDLSCVSIQKITPTQITVLPPGHMPATVSVRVYFTDDKGERIQIPAENGVDPTFTFTDEQAPTTSNTVFMNLDPLGITRLHRACASGDIHTVIACLSQKESPFQKDNFGWTSFHRACASRRLGVCKLLFLVTRGLIIEYPDYRGLSALTLLALDGDIQFVTDFWNWIRDVRHASMIVPTQPVHTDEGAPFRPTLPAPQIPSALAPENEYRRSYTAACAFAEGYLPRADVPNFQLTSADGTPLQFNTLRDTTVLLLNKQMKILSPNRNVKAVLIGINHPHFSRKESHPVYYGYSSDLTTIQEVSTEARTIDRDLNDSSILLPPLEDLDIPPYEMLYCAHDLPTVYFTVYIDIFVEEALDKVSVLRFDIPVLYHVNKPVEEIGDTHKSVKNTGNQAAIDLTRPTPLVTNASVYQSVVQPYQDFLLYQNRG